MLKKLRELENGEQFMSQGRTYTKHIPPIEQDGELWHAECCDTKDVAFPLKTDEDIGSGDNLVEVIN